MFVAELLCVLCFRIVNNAFKISYIDVEVFPVNLICRVGAKHPLAFTNVTAQNIDI